MLVTPELGMSCFVITKAAPAAWETFCSLLKRKSPRRSSNLQGFDSQGSLVFAAATPGSRPPGSRDTPLGKQLYAFHAAYGPRGNRRAFGRHNCARSSLFPLQSVLQTLNRSSRPISLMRGRSGRSTAANVAVTGMARPSDCAAAA